MTFEKLQQIIEENSIPHKATVDWECCETGDGWCLL